MELPLSIFYIDCNDEYFGLFIHSFLLELLFTFFFLFLNFSSFLYSLVYWYTCKYYNYYFTLNDEAFHFPFSPKRKEVTLNGKPM